MNPDISPLLIVSFLFQCVKSCCNNIFPAITRTTKAAQGLPDAKISLWPFLAQKMPKAVEKEKSPQNQYGSNF
jgi:hypothetical protein